MTLTRLGQVSHLGHFPGGDPVLLWDSGARWTWRWEWHDSFEPLGHAWDLFERLEERVRGPA